MPADYYRTLELERGATLKQIKHSYRRLARKHHPDFNPGDEAAEDRMEEINRAYEVLSDRQRREEYDRYRRADQPPPSRDEPRQKETFEEARTRANVLERMSPYEILGVSPNASHRDVRDAFAGFAATYGESAISDPAAALAYQHVKSAYYLLSDYERRRRYNAEHGYAEPPLPEEEEEDRPLGVLDGLGDLAWIVPGAVVGLLLLTALLVIFEPYWLR
jgi:DnaJ-class molecular chaperone